ncbi:MAG: aldo/keto reductase [Caulobacteraceae bacterium]
MRYRSFGGSGTVVSVLSLRLSDDNMKPSAEAWTRTIFQGLEAGVNCFEFNTRHPAGLEGVARALDGVERELIVAVWRVGRLPPNSEPLHDFSAAAITNQIRAVIARTGLEYLDVAMLDDPGERDLRKDGLEALLQMKEDGAARMIGVGGHSTALSSYVSTGKFDVLGTPYNLTSGWPERQLLRLASSRDMAVLGYDPYPGSVQRIAAAQEKKARSIFKRPAAPLEGVGGYGFLETTRNWSAEEICLAYAMTEPALSTIQIEGGAAARLDRLAAVADREMPSGLAAQIEMARFSSEDERRRA